MTEIEDQARALFLTVLERPPEQWSAALDEACGGNAELRARVDQLLHAHQQMGSIHGGPPKPVATIDDPITERPGTIIGPYKLLEQIGEGGFGVVFMAEQHEPVRRKVALKILKPGMDTRQVVARFEAERQALAIMDHANVAKILDGGATASGRPYFVMELVKGVPITEFCDQNHLTPRQRLELFVPVCQAVQHAHQKGIIHRDIKPSNVLVSMHDGVPAPKVIDFGVAKALGQELTDKTLFTAFAQMVGTPLYMSPEQAGGSPDIDTRSDVYSLGVLLYELLTGTTPFTKERFKKAAYDEIRRIIREEDPPKPSTRLSESKASLPSVSAQRRTEPAKLTRLVRGELDWLVMKALEKDRSRRYETANGFALDVQRYLADEPVLACPPSLGYRLGKFVRRNNTALMVSVVVTLSLLVAVGLLGWAVRDRAAREAEIEAQVAVVLAEAERLSRDGKWAEAVDPAKRAAALLPNQGSLELRRRSQELLADVEIVLRLDEARLRGADLGGAKDGMGTDDEAADLEYARVFRKYGIDVDALTATEAAERIRRRRIADQLVAGLDDWASYRRLKYREDASWKHLFAVARAADPDAWRNRLRDVLEMERGENRKRALVELGARADVKRLAAVTLDRLCFALMYAGAKEEALHLLDKARQAHPRDFWINYGLARAHFELRQPEKAIVFFVAALEARQSVTAWIALARAFLATRAYGTAILACEEALRLKPDLSWAHSTLAHAWLHHGQPDQAMAPAKEALRLDPENFSAYWALDWAYREKGDWKSGLVLLEEAVARCRRTLQQRSNHPDARFKLARTLNLLAWNMATQPEIKFRDPSRAVSLAREAFELAPDRFTRNTLGVALYRAGQPKEAVDWLRKSMVDSRNGDGYNGFFLAMAMWQLGDKDEALKWYERAANWMDRTRPPDEEIRRIRTEAAEVLGIKNTRRQPQ